MPTVGEILSAERRRQGKSLDDAVEGTKIRSRLLDALENGRYDDLPSPAYVKGYIQGYARFLEIPAVSLLEQYKQESAGAVRRTSPADRYLASIPAETVVPRRERAHEIPRNVWIAVAAGVVLVVLLLCAISRLFSASGDAPPLPAAVPSSETSAGSVGATGGSETTPVTRVGESYKFLVSIRTGLASYVKVVIDGKTGFDGTMQGGDSHEYSFSDRAVLTIAKPDAVVVTRDGKPVRLPSTPNAKVTLSAVQ